MKESTDNEDEFYNTLDKLTEDNNLENYIHSLKINKEIGDEKGIATTLYYIGAVYLDLQDFGQALSYFMKATKIQEEIGDKSGNANSLLNISRINVILNDLEQTANYLEKSLKLAKELLELKWEATDLSKKQADRITERIDFHQNLVELI